MQKKGLFLFRTPYWRLPVRIGSVFNICLLGYDPKFGLELTEQAASQNDKTFWIAYHGAHSNLNRRLTIEGRVTNSQLASSVITHLVRPNRWSVRPCWSDLKSSTRISSVYVLPSTFLLNPPILIIRSPTVHSPILLVYRHSPEIVNLKCCPRDDVKLFGHCYRSWEKQHFGALNAASPPIFTKTGQVM